MSETATTDENIVHGIITVQLFDENGNLKEEQKFHNKITDNGDLYQATRIANSVNSNGVSDATKVTGMKLGQNTGAVAEAKNGSGAALVTYITASNVAFDSGYPQVNNLGAGLGVNVTYQATWGAGVATSANINEVVIVDDSGTNATSTAGHTIARGVFGSTIVKASTDTLVVTWNHKQLGA